MDDQKRNARNALVAALLSASFSLMAVESPPTAVAGQPAVDGTYEIWICHGLCASADSTNVELKGHLVLFATPMDRKTALRLDHTYYPARPREEPNACYELSWQRRDHLSSYAGISPYGVTAWYVWRGDINVTLYHSPDAGYDATLQPTPGGLAGTGQSWGAGVAAPTKPDQQVIVARRTGDADMTLCETWATRERPTSTSP